MKLVKYRFNMQASFMTPFHSDTLMGVIAWTMKHLYGEQELTLFIERCRTAPPFVISNGFPDGYLPRPMVPIVRKKQRQLSRLETILEAKENKKLKNHHWLTYDEFHNIVNQQEVQWSVATNPIKEHTRLHAIIDRQTGQSLEKNGLYETNEFATPSVSIFVNYFDLSYKHKLEQIFAHIGQTGFGAKKSSGKGVFALDVLDEDLSFLTDVSNPNGYITLSNFVPKEDDSTQGYYKVITKYGKLGEELATAGNPHKYPMMMIQAGASFYQTQNIPYVGRLIENVSPQYDFVVQFGFGLTLPIWLPTIDELTAVNSVSV